MASIREYPDLVFEGHSTDYQTQYKLRELVNDGVGILKVGPGLTQALREGLFGLAYAEKEMLKDHPEKQSYFMEALETAMLENPKYFTKHYHGSAAEIAYKRKYSFSDRCRYYYAVPEVAAAIRKLFDNFKDGVPMGLISQFLPIQYTKVRTGKLKNDPRELVMDRVCNCIDEYLYGSMQYKLG